MVSSEIESLVRFNTPSNAGTALRSKSSGKEKQNESTGTAIWRSD
jgi:hypothetical protein